MDSKTRTVSGAISIGIAGLIEVAQKRCSHILALAHVFDKPRCFNSNSTNAIKRQGVKPDVSRTIARRGELSAHKSAFLVILQVSVT